MPADFFVFCTSLQLLEMKALGSLSDVRHLCAGETVYRPGDSADTIFIINRGIIELLDDAGDSSGATPQLLTRGAILADVEVLTATTHTQLARCQDEVSLRCFHRENLPELIQRVPAFFRFLAEELADRLLRTRDAERELNTTAGPNLAGSLSDFDLVTIYQTITTSMQTGELSILDDRSEVVAAFFFEKGQPRAAQFQHLIGEEALRQLFLLQDPQGTFLFTAARRLTSNIRGGVIERQATDMLIHALQARDEWQELREKFSDPAAQLVRQKATFSLTVPDPAIDEIAARIWSITAARKPALRDIYPALSVSEFAIYQAIDELVKSGHLRLCAPEPAQQAA